MGMIQTIMKKVPEGKSPTEFLNLLQAQALRLVTLGDSDGDRPDGAEVSVVTAEKFEELWKCQENIKEEAHDKYRGLAAEGRLMVIEIDW